MTPSLFIKKLCEHKLLLPPMSGFTDYPYRVILAQFHPPFIITEMANAKAIIRGNKKTDRILKIAEGKQYNGVQLVGNDPLEMAHAATIVEKLGFDYIDINMGCTVRKVASSGAGISLMANEKQATAIVSTVSKATNLPVTCKLRTGISRRSINVVDLSKHLVDAGAVALTIHARSGEKKFGDILDFHTITEAAATLSVPVIANGGIISGTIARTVLKQTNAAAVMPGRGLLGNPWLIPEIRSSFSETSFQSPSLPEKKDICIKHFQLLCDWYGEYRGVAHARKILPLYFTSCKFLKEFKDDIRKATQPTDIFLLLDKIQEFDGHMIYRQ